MAKEVSIREGVVVLREYLTRKGSKEYNKVLMGGVKVSYDKENGAQTDGLKSENLQEANDVLVLAMIDKINLKGGESIAPSQDFIDNIAEEDFNLILKAINEVRGTDDPEAAKKK